MVDSKTDESVNILPYIALLRTGDLKKMAVAAKALVAAGPLASRALSVVVRDRRADWWVRCEAVKALGLIGDPQTAQALITPLKDENESLSREAAEALAMIGLPAVPALIVVLKYGSSPRLITHTAANLLIRIGAASELAGVLKDQNIDFSRRYDLVLTLKWCGFPVVPALIEVLRDRSVDKRVRSEAVRILGQSKDPQAVSALISAVIEDLSGKDKQVSREAASALGSIAQSQYSHKARLPDPALRAALPILRRMERRDYAYHTALAKIEFATAAVRDLPLPASAPPLDVQALPRPADAPATDDPALSPRWWTRLRRRLKSV